MKPTWQDVLAYDPQTGTLTWLIKPSAKVAVGSIAGKIRKSDLFWNEDEWVVQYHPARAAHINVHPHCLHLWRSRKHEFPTPPTWLIA